MTPAPGPTRQEQQDACLTCSVLAAQAVVLRERIDTGPLVDLLWKATDVLASLSAWIAAAPEADADTRPEQRQQREAVLSTATDMRRALDAVAFNEAQRQDFARQLADCIVIALERLASDPQAGRSLPAHELAALYVSEDQHEVHAAVERNLTARPAAETGS
jgi:hypothetical protein